MRRARRHAEKTENGPRRPHPAEPIRRVRHRDGDRARRRRPDDRDRRQARRPHRARRGGDRRASSRATTSLSGAVVSITAALDGRAALAFSNGVGGIAAQTAFLAIADLAWRRVNLEHAAADLSNVLQATLLCLMLSLPILAFTGPDVAILGIHPVSYALPVIYISACAPPPGSARIRCGSRWKRRRRGPTRPRR